MDVELKDFLINPPFGRWVSHKRATKVMGSYTLYPRDGLISQAFKTIRYKNGGWVNSIGLRNPGIKSVKYEPDRLYSLAAIDEGDWERFLDIIPYGLMYEINLGCPNHPRVNISKATLDFYRSRSKVLSVKVSPTPAGCKEALELGGLIHMGNSLPIPGGGYSGPLNKLPILNYVEILSKAGIDVIAAGGIRTKQDIKDYRSAGAKHIGMSTAWFNPFNATRIINRS